MKEQNRFGVRKGTEKTDKKANQTQNAFKISSLRNSQKLMPTDLTRTRGRFENASTILGGSVKFSTTDKDWITRPINNRYMSSETTWKADKSMTEFESRKKQSKEL